MFYFVKVFFWITECLGPTEVGSRVETKTTKDLGCACHYVGHHEWSSVSDAGVSHVNFSVAGIRIWKAKLTAVNHLPPELDVPVIFLHSEKEKEKVCIVKLMI